MTSLILNKAHPALFCRLVWHWDRAHDTDLEQGLALLDVHRRRESRRRHGVQIQPDVIRFVFAAAAGTDRRLWHKRREELCILAADPILR